MPFLGVQPASQPTSPAKHRAYQLTTQPTHQPAYQPTNPSTHPLTRPPQPACLWGGMRFRSEHCRFNFGPRVAKYFSFDTRRGSTHTDSGAHPSKVSKRAAPVEQKGATHEIRLRRLVHRLHKTEQKGSPLEAKGHNSCNS